MHWLAGPREQSVRTPAVAGLFYPDDAQECGRLGRWFVDQAGPGPAGMDRLCGAVVPHAGEHAVELELPLIQAAWPASKLLPLGVPLIERTVEIGQRTADAVLGPGENRDGVLRQPGRLFDGAGKQHVR